jgi:toxin CcdB
MVCRSKTCASSEVAQFDIHRTARRQSLVVDCQSDLLDHIDTRFVIPLVPLSTGPSASGHLNPIVMHDDESYLLLTQTASAVNKRDLGPVVGSLEGQRLEIIRAIDVLIGGV